MAHLIVFAGPACSGKSTLAARLAAGERMPHLSMDATRKLLMPDSAHTRHDRAIAYRAMHWAAELLLSRGASVILDAPYGHREDREQVERAAVQSGAPLMLIECAVSPETAAARFRQREPGPRLDLTEERVRDLAASFRFSGCGLRLDTGALSEDECLSQIRRYLSKGRPAAAGEWSRSA